MSMAPCQPGRSKASDCRKAQFNHNGCFSPARFRWRVCKSRGGTGPRWNKCANTRAQRLAPFASRRESCVKSCDYQLLGGSSSVAGRATKQSAPNMLNPQIAIQKNVSWVKRKLGDSPDETAFFRWPLQRLLERTGFRDVRIDPFGFLHPKTPRPSQSF